MPQYLYQIKGKGGDGSDSYSTWLFPPLWTDMIEAKDKKEAKLIVEEEYGRKFPLRVLHEDLASNEFLLVIKEVKENDHHTRKLFEANTCKQCGAQFKQIEKYQLGNKGGGFSFCSNECSKKHDMDNALPHFNAESYQYNTRPVIYKITNKDTGMCYIGKTCQVFTLRWYQHFFQASDTKFHRAIKESKPTDWVFEVVETVIIPDEIKFNSKEANDLIFKREMLYINLNDSIKNGYNSVSSKNELIEEPDFQGNLFESVTETNNTP